MPSLHGTKTATRRQATIPHALVYFVTAYFADDCMYRRDSATPDSAARDG